MIDHLALFASTVSQMQKGVGPMKVMPDADAEDFQNGADHIPWDVTGARRNGETVIYDQINKTWTFPSGTVLK